MAIDKNFEDGEILYASYLNDMISKINSNSANIGLKLDKTAIKFENGYLYITIDTTQEE